MGKPRSLGLGRQREQTMTGYDATLPDHFLLRLRWRDGRGGTLPGTGVAHLAGGTGEFDGHRPWNTGDDLHQLDLGAWLRFKQRWIRQYRQDADEPVHVILDGGPTMTFGDRKNSLESLRSILRGISKSTRVPHREWLLDGSQLHSCSAENHPGEARRGPLKTSLPQISGSLPTGRIVILSDRLVFEELENTPSLSRTSHFHWWSLWNREETHPEFQGSCRLQALNGDHWQGQIDEETHRQYQRELSTQIKRLHDWLTRSRGCHHRIESADSGNLLLHQLTRHQGPLEVISG